MRHQPAADMLEDRLRQFPVELVGTTDAGRHQQHALVRDQAEFEQFAGRQLQQHLFFGRGCFGILRTCRQLRTADDALQGLRFGKAEDAHAAFFLVFAAAGFQAHFRHIHQPVQQALMQGHVLDAGERDIAHGFVQQARADHDAVGADTVTEAVITRHRQRHHHPNAEQTPQFIAVALTGKQKDENRHNELPQHIEQLEQPRQRMQPLFGNGFHHSLRGRCRHGGVPESAHRADRWRSVG